MKSRVGSPQLRAGHSAVAAIAIVLLGSLTAPRLDAQQITYRDGVPEWTVDPAFPTDVFTFARVQYATTAFGRRYAGARWDMDYPDAEMNLAFRLQQMTSLKVNPNAVVVDLAKDDVSRYPFLYIVEAGEMQLSDEEATGLRRYLLNGGFVMFDDFWGPHEWDNVLNEITRVFPHRELVDLPLEHPIFHCVFDLKEKPQVPGIHSARQGFEKGGRDVHYRAIFDDKNRMMVLICQNTDLGDGWEREGDNEEYFRTYAEKKAYPMAINILFYAMTH